MMRMARSRLPKGSGTCFISRRKRRASRPGIKPQPASVNRPGPHREGAHARGTPAALDVAVYALGSVARPPSMALVAGDPQSRVEYHGPVAPASSTVGRCTSPTAPSLTTARPSMAAVGGHLQRRHQDYHL